jgi:hypothetical protein
VTARPAFEDFVVLEDARRRTGLSDFGDPAFREPLRRLLHALGNEAALNEVGRVMHYERVVGLLVNRLRTEAAYREHPEIEEERIAPPLVIVGLPRTGTTMLHRMIASDRRFHALLWYESRSPAPLPGSEALREDPRIREAEAEVEAMLAASPDLIAVHPMDAHAPDEEIMLYEHSFLSANPEAFCHIPRYGAWLAEQDPAPGYRYLGRLLRFLQWQKKRRGERAERWVLKAPMHLAYMDLLLETLPGARVVLTHRDPIQTIPSYASMIHTLLVMGSDRIDTRAAGRYWADKLHRWLDRGMAVRDANPGSFLDVRYEELVEDPMVQVRRIYAFADMELTPTAEASMRRWAQENVRDRRPVHRYTLEQFGFTEPELREQFADYRERFIQVAEAVLGSGPESS